MESESCPDCKGTRLQRYGKTSAGLQKYRCLDEHGTGCRRQFVSGSDHLIDPEKKKAILALLRQMISPKTIAAVYPEVSKRWIYELKKRIYG